jgi:hypothetical protein
MRHLPPWAFLVVMLAWGCSDSPTEADAGEVAFETVLKTAGSLSVEPRLFAIRDAAGWDSAWAEIAGTAPPLPPVDFSTQMLLLATGTFRTERCGREEIDVLSVVARGGRLEVRVRETAPGRDCICLQVVTAGPVHAVRLARSAGPVELLYRLERWDCG